MPRSNRKKFRKFLETRRLRHKRNGSADASTFLWFDVFCAVLTPVLLGSVVALLGRTNFLYVLYPWLYWVAYTVLIVWAVLAYRGATRYWSKKADFLFGFSFALLIFFGACWGWDKPVPVKAWISAPVYAREPSIQLETPSKGKTHDVLEGSTIHLSWLGEGEPPLTRLGDQEEDLETSVGGGDMATTLVLPVTGKEISPQLILRRGLHKLINWNLHVIPDVVPQIALVEEPEITMRKTIKFVYKGHDDYGIESIAVRIAPTSSATGGTTEPVEMPLAAPVLKDIENTSYVDLTALPWAGVPVTVQLVVTDGAGHRGWSEPKVLTLPTRAFRNPFARALIEERQKFLDNPDSATRDETANVMAGIARQQGLYHGDPVVLMALRAGAVRLVLNDEPETASVISDILWKTALRLEEGAVGHARAALADAERDLSFGLMRETPTTVLHPFLFRVRDAMNKYFEALEAERARQPPSLQEMDWPLATASEMLSPEDLQGRLTVVANALTSGDRSAARESLSALQSLIENLRTTPPELTPDQAHLAQRVFALRALVRGQKSLTEEMTNLEQQKNNTGTSKKNLRDAMARALVQQQLLLSALRDIIVRQGGDMPGVRASEESMGKALLAFQKQEMTSVLQNQADAVTLLESSLSTLVEQMRRAMTAKAP